jgi:hypothetical protein
MECAVLACRWPFKKSSWLNDSHKDIIMTPYDDYG